MNPKKLSPVVALQLLELPPDSFQLIKCEKDLENLKEKVKKQRKLLAKKYHPDRFPSQHIMNEINAICDLVLNLKIKIVQRPQPVVVRYTVRSYCETSTSSTTGGYYY